MTTEYSIQKMVSDGTLSTIVLGIQYLQRNDIYIRIAEEETPQSGAPSGYTWSFLDNTTLKILPVVPNGVEVVVYRRTDVDAMYNVYSQNAQFDESTIDENNQQLLYIAQEYFEQGIPGASIEALEYVRATDDGYYYRFKLTDGSYTPEFLVPIPPNTKLANRAMWTRFAAESGYVLAAGDFETGGVLLNSTQVLLDASTQGIYSWSGVYPVGGYVVAPGTDPTAVGSGYVPRTDVVLRAELAAAGGAGLIGDVQKPITWSGFAGGAKGDSATNSSAISAANSSGDTYYVPDGYWPNTVDATFNIYPAYRNYSGGLKLKRGLPGAGAQNPYPLIWAEKTSNMQRVAGGTKWFDVAMQGALTLEPTATAFGVGVSGYIRSEAGDVLTSGKSVDAIGVHGSGKAIGQNGRVWGLWGQAGNGDDGSGVRSSQLVACELNLVNLFASQPHPENLPTGEGPYRGLIVTTADGGKGCGIAIDVGDGSGRAASESGWWTGLRLRRGGILPSGDWKNNYLEDSQQLKIEGSLSNLHRYGGIRIGPRLDGTGINLTYGLNTIGAVFQDFNAINLGSDHRIYWGAVSGVTKWVGYESETTCFNFRNMPLSINSTKVLGPRVTGINALAGTADGATKNTETVTLAELARYVKKVTDALIAHGMISPT